MSDEKILAAVAMAFYNDIEKISTDRFYEN